MRELRFGIIFIWESPGRPWDIWALQSLHGMWLSRMGPWLLEKFLRHETDPWGSLSLTPLVSQTQVSPILCVCVCVGVCVPQGL